MIAVPSPIGEKPRFAHDCSLCLFLGRDGAEDVYYCEGGPGAGSVLARASSDGPDYRSTILTLALHYDGADALHRAAVAVLTSRMVAITFYPSVLADFRAITPTHPDTED